MLELRDIEVYIGKTHVLKSVSLTVNRGEIVALIGANGAGKTTTLKTISGLLHPRTGSVEYCASQTDGRRDISHLPAEEIVPLGISHCPEGRQILTSLNVRENLLLGGYLRRDREEIRRDLAYVNELFPILKERWNQPAGNLSGGEQMMLAIGRALMSRPSLMILDEPSLGLAPLLIEKVFDLLARIHRDGTTILIVEQNAARALEIADRAYVLETGKITLEGTGRELRNNPAVQKAYLGL